MRLFSRLWPEERIAALFFAGIAALFAARLYPFTIWPLFLSYLQFLGVIALAVIPPRLVVDAVRRRRGTHVPGATRRDLVAFARALVSLLVVLIAYTNLKCRLLLFHPRLFDQILERLDDVLHAGGGDFIAWVTTFHSHQGTIVSYYFYYYAWAALALPLAVAMARRQGDGETLVRRTLAALGLCYIVGVFLYLALPTLGPAMVERERYSALAGTSVFTLQQTMLGALRHIVQNPLAPAVPFFGLAAFPSLHLATSSLGILLAWKTWRPLLFLLVPWNLAIAASAIYFGWHYVVDFYPALLLAGGSWWAAGRWVGLPSSSSPSATKPPAESSPLAAGADPEAGAPGD
ncbi:MAG: phosphatase PAP2 family protein [Thermoanaerobaculia bacterium]